MYKNLNIETIDNATIPFCEFVDAYYDCRRTKRRKQSAIEFELNWWTNLYELYEEVNARTYMIGTSITFVTTRPKKREVFAASFRDRIIHHLVCRKIEPLFESYFIEDTYNCRKGKGTTYGVNRLFNKVAEVSRNYTRDCWIAKFDMKGFFMSIHKPTLCNMLEDFIVQRYKGNDIDLLLWLVRKIVLHSPEKKCIRKMPVSMWRDIPDNKSLFTNGDEYGLPIGNLTSQMFANFYLSAFDKWMESSFCYGRYVDDFYIVDTNKKKIVKSIPSIRRELNKIRIELNPTKIYIQHYTKGCSFIGGIVKMQRIYSCNRTVSNFIEAINTLNGIEDKKEEAEHAVQQINSYLGFLMYRQTYKFRKECISRLSTDWYKYLYIVGDFYKVKLKYAYSEKYRSIRIERNMKISINKKH